MAVYGQALGAALRPYGAGAAAKPGRHGKVVQRSLSPRQLLWNVLVLAASGSNPHSKGDFKDEVAISPPHSNGRAIDNDLRLAQTGPDLVDVSASWMSEYGVG